MLADEGLELGDELGVAAEGEVGLDPLLEGGQVQLLEASDLALREGLGREVRKRRSAPERECRSQGLRRALGLALGEELSTLAEQALEPAEVELLGLERKQVPLPTRLQTPVAERLAELRDVDVDAVEGARGRVFVPERVDQAVRGDDLAGAQEKECEQRPLLARADLERLPALGRLERAEDAELDRVVTSGQAASFSARLKRRTSRIQALLKSTTTCSGRSFWHREAG